MANGTTASLSPNTSAPPPEGPGATHLTGRWIMFLSGYLVILTVVALYAVIKLWPHPTPSGLPATPTPETSTAAPGNAGTQNNQGTKGGAPTAPTKEQITQRQNNLCSSGDATCRACVAREMQLQYESRRPNDPQCTYVFGLHFMIWQEERLLLLVLLAGAVGALLHAIRSLTAHVGNRNFVTSWIAFYYLSPVAGSAIAFVAYIAIRGGFFSSTATTADANPFMFVALAAFSGLFSQQVLEKLRKVAETAFDKAPQGKDSLPADQTTAPPSPAGVPGSDAENQVDGCDAIGAPGAPATSDEELPAAEGGVQ